MEKKILLVDCDGVVSESLTGKVKAFAGSGH